MEIRAFIFSAVFSISMIVWLVWDQFTPIPKNLHFYRYVTLGRTNEQTRARDILDLGKVIRQSDYYVNNTSPVERLYDMIYQINLEVPFPVDQSYTNKRDLEISGSPRANLSKCHADLKWILSRLDQFGDKLNLARGKEARELTQLVDSNGKPQSGLYDGVVNWPGSYRLCKAVKLSKKLDQFPHDDTKSETLEMNYCWSKFKPKGWPKNDNLADLNAVIRVGTCLPESCDTQSFEHLREEISELIKYDWPTHYRDNLELFSMFCLPNEQSPLRQIPFQGRILLWVLGCWIFLVILATIISDKPQSRDEPKKVANEVSRKHLLEKELESKFEACGNSSKFNPSKQELEINGSLHSASLWEQIIQALSLKTGLESFMNLKPRARFAESHRKDRLDTRWLDFLKVIFTIIVCIIHTSMLMSYHLYSLGDRVRIFSGVRGYLMISLCRPVDVYFIIFGLLGSMDLSKSVNSSIGSVWLDYNLRKFVRVGPLMIITYSFSRYIGPYIGHGPWWDYGVHAFSNRGLCLNEEWWKIVPYLGTFGEIPIWFCVPQAWFLLVYVQSCLFMPFIVYIICRLPSNAQRFNFIVFLSLSSSLLSTSRLLRQDSIPDEAFSQYGAFLATILDRYQNMGVMSTYSHI